MRKRANVFVRVRKTVRCTGMEKERVSKSQTQLAIEERNRDIYLESERQREQRE